MECRIAETHNSTVLTNMCDGHLLEDVNKLRVASQ